MADIYINDNALIDFERGGAQDLYALWVDSVQLLSRRGRLRMSAADVEALWNLGAYERTSGDMATSLVQIGYWGTMGREWFVIPNGSWALNDPEDFVEDLDSLIELRPCDQCPAVTDELASLAAQLGTMNRRTLIEELHEYYVATHADHAAPEGGRN